MNEFHNKIEAEYFNWLCNKIQVRRKKTYKRLYFQLYFTGFRWSIPLDKNRSSDGVSLRYIFAMEVYGNPDIESKLPKTDSNVLEMMAALSDRLDREYTGDLINGSRAYIWFWNMMKNLGLDDFDDLNYDENRVGFIITRMLNRQYRPDGLGNLFYLPNTNEDVRTMEIWKQAMRYVNEIDI